MRLLDRLFGGKSADNAASELVLARMDLSAATEEHERRWKAFQESAAHVQMASRRLNSAREEVLREAERWATSRDRDGGSAGDPERGSTAKQRQPGPQASPKS